MKLQWWIFALLLWFGDTLLMWIASYMNPEIKADFSFLRILKSGWAIHRFIEEIIAVLYRSTTYSLFFGYLAHCFLLISKNAITFILIIFLAVVTPMIYDGIIKMDMDRYFKDLDTTLGISCLFMTIYSVSDYFRTLLNWNTLEDPSIDAQRQLYEKAGLPLPISLMRDRKAQMGFEARKFLGWTMIASWPWLLLFEPLLGSDETKTTK